MRPLYPHQTRALDLLRQSLGQGRRRPMLQAPTGFGKTLLSAAIVDGEPDERTGLRRLYVCLTRAVSGLTALHATPLPPSLS